MAVAEPSGACKGRVLLVGTTNVARSAFAERLLAEGLAGTNVKVSSCGTEAAGDSAMDPEMARQLKADCGADEQFSSRALTPALVREADLVLCMTRAERRQVVRTAPQGLRYTFALADFSDVATKLLDAASGAKFETDVDNSAVGHVAQLAVQHRDEVHARLGNEADVPDPGKGGSAAYERCAGQLRDMAAPIVAVLIQAAGRAS